MSPSHCPRLLALVRHTTCRCWMPSPQVAEHCHGRVKTRAGHRSQGGAGRETEEGDSELQYSQYPGEKGVSQKLPAGSIQNSLSSSPTHTRLLSDSPEKVPHWPSPSHPLTAHLGPGSCPPLGWAGHSETGPPGLRPVPRASFGWHGLVGTIGERQQALHTPSLHPQFPTAPAASSPLLHHPPGERQGRRQRTGGTMGTLPSRVTHTH